MTQEESGNMKVVTIQCVECDATRRGTIGHRDVEVGDEIHAGCGDCGTFEHEVVAVGS